jgi:hypothetical protein
MSVLPSDIEQFLKGILYQILFFICDCSKGANRDLLWEKNVTWVSLTAGSIEPFIFLALRKIFAQILRILCKTKQNFELFT